MSLSLSLGHRGDIAVMNGDSCHNQAEEANSKQDGNADADAGEDANEQEVIVIQDTGFTVKIQAPGTEPFDLQVSGVFAVIALSNRNLVIIFYK